MAQKAPNNLKQDSLYNLEKRDDFISRHIGPDDGQINAMLAAVGASSLDDLITQTVPANILKQDPMDLDAPRPEHEVIEELAELADNNVLFKTWIGLGYHGTLTPNVILRNVLENPGWYTAYTPYQPEIAQGRLEALLNFQQMILDLTGMELANASLLDEGTAAAEAMALCKRMVKKNKSNVFFIDQNCHPQTIAVVKTRAEHLGFEVIVGDNVDGQEADYFGQLLQYPGSNGEVKDLGAQIERAHAANSLVVVAADIMSLMLLKSPGELGADVVVGSTQRFGVPIGFGGPHAAFFASREKFKRSIPGRIIGVSVDSHGEPALRMAMQTREQHIRREKATSNICTAQALLAIMAVSYAIYHGPDRLKTIASRIHRLSCLLEAGLDKLGFKQTNAAFFDTVAINTGDDTDNVMARALEAEINLRKLDENTVTISFDETTTLEDVDDLFAVFADAIVDFNAASLDDNALCRIPESLLRDDDVLSHAVFNSYHSETEMLRYLKRLENKDVALNRSMIALGSCTMKLNATAEMIPIAQPGFNRLHPFVPKEQAQGYLEMTNNLEQMLVACTGYDAVSLQPNAGSQGEYAGLLAIKRFHESNGEGHRNIVLIPRSAHGTNPASASLASLKSVIVDCDSLGNVDLADLNAKAELHADNLAAIMITYPSTHGVFEESIREICATVHDHGGQVYLDGANMNAMVGIAAPGKFGADVSHLNLHKTFAIPHGGGGPGVGPIAVGKHLQPFLPTNPLSPINGLDENNDVVSSAAFGSASVLPISYAYIALLGAEGLRRATQVAILNANYMAGRLKEDYPVLYTGRNDRVAHECIIDLRPLKESSGISEEDIAKRLMDFGFHSPTMSFPVPGTLMIEPTESESKREIDLFCDAMAQIKREIELVENGTWSLEDNPLVNAPHSLKDIVEGEWQHSYSREQAAYPIAAIRDNKYWPPVNRVDNVYGDRNLICSCPSIESYED
ncbi:glycine dehydrogenase [Sinobacterium caligoides]|uniref:Glycine dehydrogenase (decarboxylating) n=1 Tax=Sinobacterium caligoides TaxID=933926 RepID=A0A3N2DN69_9GAMM|nr:aminomethyl-transferring glycine dehydrogenase [Sinobacterium caligoides]ROS01253.1 glycine dehydrogenase [Sinobacterium caligoides]